MTLQVITVPETTQILKGDDAQALHIITISETPALDIFTEENSEVQVVTAADSLWEPDGTGYIRPKSNMKVKGENVEIDISGKVDKVEGMGLSTEDFTTELAEKLASLENYDATELTAMLTEKSRKAIQFVIKGDLEVEDYACPAMVPFFMTITEAYAQVRTAPDGADILLDIDLNDDGTIYTTVANKPAILNGGNLGGVMEIPDVFELGPQDMLYLHVKQVGSVTPGTDLVVTLIGEVGYNGNW